MMVVMRYPDGHKQAVKERIVGAASQALRRHGLAGISIPAVMKQAGLTHGGFYSHFKDRDALVAAAVRAAADATAAGVFAAALSREQTLAGYLSKGHVDHPDAGCVLAALGTDGARQSAPVRAAFAEVARGFFRLAASKLDRRGGDHPSDAALVGAATMVGAVVLARLVRDPALSERLLAACRTALAR